MITPADMPDRNGTEEMDLVPFLEGLGRDYRGWNGERVRQTDDQDLAVTAVFRSGGARISRRPW
ncbi:DUF6228 family protein [Actinacidiphila sp. DG2A-62]|uniref:DUF6228 family protein n=1 Tax=Actinacidiphila sp. DG2A-62 TaxID=3108821 RepID=UPI002DB99480|nr:DUF6228 family protein [Actinacidiphila sp. DG2A-62]MEC3992126.1 DUF6228 family protein [Actinacidiphila sp. DG2A-62]